MAKVRAGRAQGMAPAIAQAPGAPRKFGPAARSFTALTLVLALAGCSQLPDAPDWATPPDWVNPTNWGNPVDWFGDMFGEDVENLPPAPRPSARAPGADKPFPKLGETPAKPEPASSAESRQKLANSLVADRDNARYTDQNLRAGDQRMAAAPPKPASTPVAKPRAPMAKKPASKKQLAAIPATKGTAARPASPSLPAPPRPVAGRASNSSGLTRVPSIVQRRGSLPPPPEPVAEVSRRPIPQVVQKSAASTSSRQVAGVAALPKAPAAVAPITRAPAAATPAATLAAPKLIPPPAQAVAMQSPSVQVNLGLGQDQTILQQAFASSLAAQGSPVVRQPGNVFNAPNAAPIAGQWPTKVPGVVQQAFNASLSGTDQGVQAGAMASPQMSNSAMRRLPGAPVLIRFRHGSTRLSGQEKKRLGQLASQVRQQGKTIYVVGHASQRTGDMDYAKHKLVNFNVSLDRANRVAGELRRRGVAAQQIVVQAKGDAEPLYFEFMPGGEAKNRRVEVFVR
ncbi:MAG: OmpA family protein [Alphaproteobacteria bacterium]|nr:OmpA family protein [Alphaproteobacteria bacterium]MDP6873045.1 OmpA family protein [Alphaproteobacteria bacterium]